MADLRRRSLPLLFLLLQAASTVSLDYHGGDVQTSQIQRKLNRRNRRIRNLSKRRNVWYHSSSSHRSDSKSRSSSRSYGYSHPVLVLFPSRPFVHDELSSVDDTDSPTRSPTHPPTLFPSALPTESSNVPTQTLSNSPSIQPSSGPSPIPSATPSTAPSTSPSIVASEAPSMTSSARPTSSLAPSSHPSAIASQAPSAVASEGPTTSTLPSSSPSAIASSSPSALPSFGPSAMDSEQPTSSLVPSTTPSISQLPSIGPSQVPTLVSSAAPSSSNGPSVQPTIVLSDAPSGVPSMMPSTLPSFFPSMQPSTPAPFETAPPSEARVSQSIPTFTLEYQLFDFENPTEADLVELEALTRSYLSDYIAGAISDNNVLLDDFFTTAIEQVPDADSLTILVTFQSTAFYDEDSPTIPPVSEIVDEIENAFTGEEREVYLGQVQSLPISNVFDGTIEVFLISQLGAESTTKSTTVLIVAGGMTALLCACSFLMYRRRKRQSRREASKEFLDILSRDLSTEFSSNETVSCKNDMEVRATGDNDFDVCMRERQGDLSSECLAIDDTTFSRDSLFPSLQSRNKGMTPKQKLGRKMNRKKEAGRGGAAELKLESCYAMEEGEFERLVTASTPSPKNREPYQHSPIMDELNDALEVRNARRKSNSTKRIDYVPRKSKVSSPTQLATTDGLQAILLKELKEKIRSLKHVS